MGKGTHLTDADHDEIWDLYAQGLNANEIHQLVGRSYSTVEKVSDLAVASGHNPGFVRSER